jgi:predicted glycogen debranching enzyme
MSYIEFEKEELINLKYSLSKEFIRTNRAGIYGSSTIINCNTRKYHGLLVCPIDELDGESHLLLSALDETIVQHEKEFHLAVRKYPGVVHPGHKYVSEFIAEPIPCLRYRVGGVVFEKQMLIPAELEQIIIKYTLVDSSSPTLIKLHPFLAFRNIHQLSKANSDIQTWFEEIPNGIKTRMYNAYPFLHMQMSKKVDYKPNPDWFYNVQYSEEENRGYEYTEDLFIPGFFQFSLEKGESIFFSASLNETKPQNLKQKFESELKKRIPRNNFENCLANSAQQFIVRRKNKTMIMAGYPWFGSRARETFISLPGLTLAFRDTKTMTDAIESMFDSLNNGLFIQKGTSLGNDYESADTSLWFFWTIQQYVKFTVDAKTAWMKYGQVMKSILGRYKSGIYDYIKMQENGLVYASCKGKALTWMDAVKDGIPVTPRQGYPVEINALWYNAIVFSLELANQSSDSDFIAEWFYWPDKIKDSFIQMFWLEKEKYLADFVNETERNTDVRPNQVIACSLPNMILTKDQAKQVLDVVKSELLTPRGLRSLSPNSENYIGVYEGNQASRDAAYHQGTVWPWLLGPFCDAWLRVHKKAGIGLVKELYSGFEPEMTNAGIGSISEIFDGNPPYEAKGAISYACTIAELIRIKKMIDAYENDTFSK